MHAHNMIQDRQRNLTHTKKSI